MSDTRGQMLVAVVSVVLALAGFVAALLIEQTIEQEAELCELRLAQQAQGIELERQRQ